MSSAPPKPKAKRAAAARSRIDSHQWPRAAGTWSAARTATYIAQQSAKPKAVAIARLNALFNEAIIDRAIAKWPELQQVMVWLRESIHAAPHDATAEEMMDLIRRHVSRVDAVDHRVGAAEAQLAATRARVLAAWQELLPSQRGRPAAGILATKLRLSATTVRTHLEAAGLRTKPK
jgi:hypothetical protein